MEAAPGGLQEVKGVIGATRDSSDIRQLAQTLIDQHDKPAILPLPLIELIELLTDSLAPPAPTETRELVVRSLRSCSSRVVDGHDRVLHGVTPLLLDPSLPLRLQAAGCLLQYSSTATTSTLCKHSLPLSSIIARALAPLQYTSQHSALRLVSTCLRILHVLFSKISPLPPEVVTSSIHLLGMWVYYRPGVPGGASPAPGRGRPTPSGGALAFGVMGAFLPASPTKKKSVRSLSRSSSRSSLAGWMSDSEEDEGQVEQRKDAIQARLDALAALRALALNDPRALYTQWSLFFADSPYLRHRPSLINLVESDPSSTVRLRACSALAAMLEASAAYLAIAEDRPTKASFTSLSSRLGEVVSELHLRLITLIYSHATTRHADLLLALLQLAGTLGKNAPYGRISRPLAQPLINAITPLLRSRDTSTAVAAASALVCITRNALSTSSTASLDATDLSRQALSLLIDAVDVELQVEAWTLLGATAVSAECLELTTALDLLRDGFASAPLIVQEAQMDWIASLFKPSPPSPLSASPTLSLQPYAASLLRVVRVAIASERPQLRASACGVLASPLLLELDDYLLPFDPISEAVRLTRDSEASVRSAASRTLGVLVKSPSFDSTSQLLAAVIDVLVIRLKDEDLVKASASWSLANCCDVLTPACSAALDFPTLLETILSLASANSGDKIEANGLRALGSLLKMASADSSISDASVSEAVDALCSGLQTGPPKVRWNAAAAIGSALASPLLAPPSSSHPDVTPRLIDALSFILSSSISSNYKVRIQAATSLIVPQERAAFGAGEEGEEGSRAFSRVRRRVLRAREELKEEEAHVSTKEKAHLSQLLARLNRCISHFDSLAIEGDDELLTRLDE